MPTASLTLDDVLRNEADMGFRRRVQTVFELLDAQPGDRVLDCGCGHGFYLRALAELRRPWVAGVEYRQFWLDQAWRELAGTGAQLVRGDICRLSFADQSFDKLILSEVLEHVPDDRAALQEAYRVLRPGGVVAITVPHANYPFLWDPVNKVLERFFGTHLPREPLWLGGIWADHFRLYTTEVLVERVEQAGFRAVELRRLTHHCFPFAHHLYYGLGKYLLLSGLLPRSLCTAADRFRYRENTGSPLNPINLGVRFLRAIDALNDQGDDYASYLNIGLKAVRP
ncbi:MAG: methyltransferase domain-containing protein [Chloroflexi bacterium]|nr:methyltransferase domain-containing protein [Chloroflexota bacterium]